MKRHSLRLALLVLYIAASLSSSCTTTDKALPLIRQRLANLEDRLNRLEEIRTQQANLGADLDTISARLSSLENQMEESRRSSAQSLPPKMPLAPVQAGYEAPHATPSQPVTVGTVGYASPSGTGVIQDVYSQPVTASDCRQPGNGTEQLGEQVARGDGDPAMTLYNEAHAQFKLRNYDTAQSIWSQFAQNYKKHSLVPTAFFWQGECYYQMTDYNRAILAYQEVIGKFPKSSKYPISLLKQGMSFVIIGKKQAGTFVLQEVIRKYPNTPEAKRAQDFLKSMHL